MKKFTILSAIMMFCVCFGCKAQGGRLTYGAEWGCDIQYITYIDYNYIGEDGSNVSENSLDFSNPLVNGFAEAKIGINANDKINVSLLSGIKGLGRNGLFVPIDLKLSFLPKGIDENGLLLSCGIGLSFSIPNFVTRNTSAFLSAGYHHPLKGGISLDLFGGFRVNTDHPLIYDNTSERYVPEKDIRKNDAFFGSVFFSIALNFRSKK